MKSFSTLIIIIITLTTIQSTKTIDSNQLPLEFRTIYKILTTQKSSDSSLLKIAWIIR